jgi:hypothetical protein
MQFIVALAGRPVLPHSASTSAMAEMLMATRCEKSMFDIKLLRYFGVRLYVLPQLCHKGAPD